MENKDDLSLSDFITEKLLKKERRPAFRRLRKMEASREKRIDDKIEAIRERKEALREKVEDFYVFMGKAHDLVPKEVFDKDLGDKPYYLADNIHYENSVYKGKYLLLETAEYSLKADIFPSGCDYSIRDKNKKELAGWNDQSHRFKNFDIVSEFEMKEEDRELVKKAIKELEPEVDKANQYLSDKLNQYQEPIRKRRKYTNR